MTINTMFRYPIIGSKSTLSTFTSEDILCMIYRVTKRSDNVSLFWADLLDRRKQ